MSDDEIRDFLRRRGSPENVVTGGLDGLLDQWGRVVEQVEDGYPFTLDDYLNDLDGRQLIHEVMGSVSGAATRARGQRLEELDRRMRAGSTPRRVCLWGDKLAKRSGWSRDVEWWYWAEPNDAGEDLANDLGSE